MKRTLRNIRDHSIAVAQSAVVTLGAVGVVSLTCAGVMGAFYLPVIGLEAASEAIANSPRSTHRATLREKDKSLMLGIHGELWNGTFDLGNGQELKAVDGLRVLDGKYFMNSVMPRLQEGRTYDIEVVGTDRWGYKIVNAQEVGDNR